MKPPGWRLPGELKLEVQRARRNKDSIVQMYGGVDRSLEIDSPLVFRKLRLRRELLRFRKRSSKNGVSHPDEYHQWYVWRDHKTGRFARAPQREKLGDEYKKKR